MNKKLKIGLAVSACSLLCVSAMLLVQNTNFASIADAETKSTTIVLDASKAPTTSSTYVESVDYTEILYSTFTYKKVKASNGNLCTLREGGSITRNLSEGLISLNVTFTGSLVVNTSFTEGGKQTTYVLTSGQTTTLCGNYFTVVANSETTINQLTLSFGCWGHTHETTHAFAPHFTESSVLDGYKCGLCDYVIREGFYSVENAKLSNDGSLTGGAYDLTGSKSATWTFLSESAQTISVSALLASSGTSVSLDGVKVYLNDALTSLGTSTYTAPDASARYDVLSLGDLELPVGISTVKVVGSDVALSLGGLFLENVNYPLTLKTINDVTVNAVGTYTIEAENTYYSNAYEANFDGVKAVKFVNNGKMKFVINSTAATKAKFSVTLANHKTAVDLRSVIKFNVNGNPLFISDAINVPANTSTYEFKSYTLPNLVLVKGVNTIEVTLENVAANELVFDKFVVETVTPSKAFESIDDYFMSRLNPNASGALEFDIAKIRNYSTDGERPYMHALASDGKFIFGARTSYVKDELRPIAVCSYDFNGNLISSSPTIHNSTSESNAGLTVKDGKVIIFQNDGTEKAITYNADGSFGSAWEDYTGFKFNEIETATPLQDVVYSASHNRLYVKANDGTNNVYIYENDATESKNNTLVGTFALKSVSGASFKRMTVSDNYIIANYSGDGVYSPKLAIYTTNGEYLYTTSLDYTVEEISRDVAFGEDQKFDTAKSSTQGILYINNNLYFTSVCWGQPVLGDKAAIVKCSAKTSLTSDTYTLTPGEYMLACKAEGVTPVVTGVPYDGANGGVAGTSTYSMGGAYDGTYMYYSTNAGGNQKTNIYKCTPSSREIVAQTGLFEVTTEANPGDNSRIFLKDGYVYVIGPTNLIYRIATNKIGETKPELTNEFSSLYRLGTIMDMNWIESARMYTVITLEDRKIHFVNEDLTLIKSLTTNVGLNKISAMASDNQFAYVIGTANSAYDIKTEVYNFNGELVGDFTFHYSFPTIDCNPQGLYMVSNNLHICVASWAGGYQTMNDYIANVDTSKLSLIK